MVYGLFIYWFKSLIMEFNMRFIAVTCDRMIRTQLFRLPP